MNLIIFDFDGTIAYSVTYHRQGWEATLKQLDIQGGITNFLPYEKNLQERYDSYNRIKKAITIKKARLNGLKYYFNESNIDKIAYRIMDMKESFTVNAILTSSFESVLSSLGKDVVTFIENIKTQDKKNILAIISSSRKPIISSYLYKLDILKYFSCLITEEDMYSGNKLMDKPNNYSYKVLLKTLKKEEIHFKRKIYIGDDGLIDKNFSQNCGIEFVLRSYKDTFTTINI